MLGRRRIPRVRADWKGYIGSASMSATSSSRWIATCEWHRSLFASRISPHLLRIGRSPLHSAARVALGVAPGTMFSSGSLLSTLVCPTRICLTSYALLLLLLRISCSRFLVPHAVFGSLYGSYASCPGVASSPLTVVSPNYPSDALKLCTDPL